MSHLTQLVVGGRAYRARPAPENEVLVMEYNVVALDDRDQAATVTTVNNPVVEIKLHYRDLHATEEVALKVLWDSTSAYYATLQREASYISRRLDVLTGLMDRERARLISQAGVYRR